jgi:hypothetical protein
MMSALAFHERFRAFPSGSWPWIEETGDRAGASEILVTEEDTMLKTISAALLAVSVLAAPAFAASGKTAPAVKPTAAKTSLLNAHARMGKHHHKYVRNYRHRHHNVGAIKTHAKVGFKHAAPVSTRHG